MIANDQWANQLDTNNSANKGARHLAARIGVSPSDGEVGSPPLFAVVRDLEVAAKKRRGSPRLGVLQPGAGRVGQGDPQNSASYATKPTSSCWRKYGRLRD
jgi:hypothetical protein